MPNDIKPELEHDSFETPMLVAFGSNLAFDSMTPRETVRNAVAALSTIQAQIVRLSPFFKTPAFPAGSGPDFVNAAAVLRFPGTPQALLDGLLRIEAHFGRDRKTRWGPRVLDLDLLAAGDQILPDRQSYGRWAELAPERQAQEAPGELILPHPRLHERAFVLVPLAHVAPDWTHPVLGKTVLQMRDALPAEDLAEVVRLDD